MEVVFSFMPKFCNCQAPGIVGLFCWVVFWWGCLVWVVGVGCLCSCFCVHAGNFSMILEIILCGLEIVITFVA